MVWFVLYVILVACCGLLASGKGRSVVGWVLASALLTPLAILVLLCLSDQRAARAEIARNIEESDRRACPYCAEDIKREASICKHCGKDVEPLPPVEHIACWSCGKETPVSTGTCFHCKTILDRSKA